MYKLRHVFISFICICLIGSISLWILRGLFPCHHIDLIGKYCDRYGIDKNLVSALVKAESNYKEDAVSHAGAKGIMQITDETFDFCAMNTNLENTNAFDVESNIHAGVWYLSFLSQKYNNNTTSILAAYNAGMGNVDEWLKDKIYSRDGKILHDIPFEETKRYTEKIYRYKTIYSILY